LPELFHPHGPGIQPGDQVTITPHAPDSPNSSRASWELAA
jgi:hypothetical protein